MHRIAGLRNLAWRKSEREPFVPSKKDIHAAFSKRSALRESLLGTWKVDAHKVLEIHNSRWKRLMLSYVSFGRVCPSLSLSFVA